MLSMKKVIVICFIICSLTSLSDADEKNAVFLDLNEPDTEDLRNYKELKYNKLDVKKDDSSIFASYENIDRINNPNPNSLRHIVTEREKKFREKTTIGVKYDTNMKLDSATQSRTLYTKYNLTDRMSLGSSYKTNPMSGMSEQMKGTISIAPEYKLTKRTAIKNVYSKNFGDNSHSGELQLKYNPFKDNRMDMSIGAGQTVYDDNRESSSKIHFGTNFKF